MYRARLSAVKPAARLTALGEGPRLASRSPGWRNWETRQTQNLVGGNAREGSTPSPGTNLPASPDCRNPKPRATRADVERTIHELKEHFGIDRISTSPFGANAADPELKVPAYDLLGSTSGRRWAGACGSAPSDCAERPAPQEDGGGGQARPHRRTRRLPTAYRAAILCQVELETSEV